MGLFFDRKTPSPELVSLMTEALRTTATPESAHESAVNLATSFAPLMQVLGTSVASQTPENINAVAATNAQAVVDQLLGGATLNTGRFLISLSIWVALVGGAIVTEATHLTTSSGALFGFAGALFGIVTAFLGTEKGGS